MTRINTTRVPSGQHYFYISTPSAVGDLEVKSTTDQYLDSDNLRFKNGNYFLNRQDGEEVVRIINTELLKLRPKKGKE